MVRMFLIRKRLLTLFSALTVVTLFTTATVPTLAQENLNDIQADQKFKDDALAKELIDARKRKDKGKFQSLLNQYLRQADQSLASVPPTSTPNAGILVRECAQGSLDAAIGDCLDYLDSATAAAYQNSYWAMKRALSVLMVAEAAGLSLGSQQEILGPITSKLKNSVYNPPTGSKNSVFGADTVPQPSKGKSADTPLEGSAIALGGDGTGSRHGDVWSVPVVEEKKPIVCDIAEGANGNCYPQKPASQSIFPVEITAASASLVKSKLKLEAAKYLAAGQIQAYMRQVAIAGVSKEEFEQEMNKLLRQCKSDSPIADSLIKISTGALSSYNQEVSDPKNFKKLHREAAIQNAVRLATLENDMNALKQDFDQVPPSVVHMVEKNLTLRIIPGLRTFAKLADESGAGVRQKLANNKQRPCGSQSLALVNVGTQSQFAHDVHYSDADKVLMLNHEFPTNGEKPASSSFFERCKLKEAWMQNKTQEMAQILAQYPELGSEVPNKPGLSVYQMINTRLPGSSATYGIRGTEEALEKVISERNKDDGTFFKKQGILLKIRENIKNICNDPEGAGTALFQNDTLLRKFLSCNNQAPLPATENNFSNTGTSPYSKNCEEIRKSSSFACDIRQEKELRDFGLETAIGTFDMGMDLLGASSLGKALAQETGATFFKSLGTGFKEAAVSRRTYGGMAIGLGIGGYSAVEAHSENSKSEAEFFAGQTGHEKAIASRNAYHDSKNGLVSDTVLGAVIPQGHSLKHKPVSKMFEDGHSFLSNRTDLTQSRRRQLAKALRSAEEKATKSLAFSDAIQKAHEVGSDSAGQYSVAAIKEKTRILKKAGFNAQEREALLRSGVTGDYENLRMDFLQAVNEHRMIETSPGVYSVETPGRISSVGDPRFISYKRSGGVRLPAKVTRMDLGKNRLPLVEVELLNGSKLILNHEEVQSARPSSNSKSQFQELKNLVNPYVAPNKPVKVESVQVSSQPTIGGLVTFKDVYGNKIVAKVTKITPPPNEVPGLFNRLLSRFRKKNSKIETKIFIDTGDGTIRELSPFELKTSVFQDPPNNLSKSKVDTNERHGSPTLIRNDEAAIAQIRAAVNPPPNPNFEYSMTSPEQSAAVQKAIEQYKSSNYPLPFSGSESKATRTAFNLAWKNRVLASAESLPLVEINTQHGRNGFSKMMGGIGSPVWRVENYPEPSKVIRFLGDQKGLNAVQNGLAISKINSHFGNQFTPKARLVRIKNPQTGKLQVALESEFINGIEYGYAELANEKYTIKSKRDMSDFTFFIGEDDGNGRNFIIDQKKNLKHIDMDRSLQPALIPQGPKDREFFGNNFAREHSRDFIRYLEEFTPEKIRAELNDQISPQAIEGLIFRRQVILNDVHLRGPSAIIE